MSASHLLGLQGSQQTPALFQTFKLSKNVIHTHVNSRKMNLKKCFAGSIFLAKIYILLSVHYNAKVIRNDYNYNFVNYLFTYRGNSVTWRRTRAVRCSWGSMWWLLWKWSRLIVNPLYHSEPKLIIQFGNCWVTRPVLCCMVHLQVSNV